MHDLNRECSNLDCARAIVEALVFDAENGSRSGETMPEWHRARLATMAAYILENLAEAESAKIDAAMSEQATSE